MFLELTLQRIGNSLGIVLPKEALARLNASEGDTLVFTEAAGGGFRVTPEKDDFSRQMALAEDISRRYRNALEELAR
jgi:putative addiction module antidote